MTLTTAIKWIAAGIASDCIIFAWVWYRTSHWKVNKIRTNKSLVTKA